MFEFFPGDHAWSSTVNLALMAGGSLGDMECWLGPLRDLPAADPSAADPPLTRLDAWAAAWAGMAHRQEELAARDLKAGYPATAGARYLRASVYHASGQREIPLGPAKSESYAAALQAFGNAMECAALPLERVHIDSPDGMMPGYLIAPDAGDPRPVVIVYGGLDLTKELMYAVMGTAFARRGVTCLVVDTPGTGEMVRLRGVPSRPDYEVPTAAIIDYLETRRDVDARRVAVLGISFGGYYAARAAAFEPRVSACVSWAGNWDCGAVWRRRWDDRSGYEPASWFLPWVLGTPSVERALERLEEWTLATVWPRVTQPLLIVHGEDDREIPVADARRAFEAAGSEDKTLRVFASGESGAEHMQTDDPDPTLRLIAEWLSLRIPAEASLPPEAGDLPGGTNLRAPSPQAV
ncbi:alpha/beta fold hydrolase [Streptosporangium sp. NPDC049046]|uniref:alpha/beta hydrolase family protein n=1 Tax=unclassified Streptosporangium TaxID=2632669 RepID=UPI003432CC07